MVGVIGLQERTSERDIASTGAVPAGLGYACRLYFCHGSFLV